MKMERLNIHKENEEDEELQVQRFSSAGNAENVQ